MRVLKQSLDIDASPAEVWRVLTTPELVREWAAAYVDGVSIRTSWREGDPVVWTAPGGETRVRGSVAAFRPEKLLKFVYGDEGVAPEARSFADTFELTGAQAQTHLELTTGPLDEAAAAELEGPTERAILEIKSLAEESAQIHQAIRRAS